MALMYSLRISFIARRSLRSSLDDPRDVLKSAFGEIERHHEIRCYGRKPCQEISRSQPQHLIPHQKLAAGAKADIDGHVVAGLPAPWIDIDPGVAQAHRLKLLAMLADGGVQQREYVPHAFRD